MNLKIEKKLTCFHYTCPIKIYFSFQILQKSRQDPVLLRQKSQLGLLARFKILKLCFFQKASFRPCVSIPIDILTGP